MQYAKDGTAQSIAGSDVYEWLPGRFFMLHKVDVRMGNERAESTEIIGFDEESQRLTMHAYDNKGIYTSMTASYDNGVWHFNGDHLRFTGGFNADGSQLSGNWELQNEDGEWSVFIKIHLQQ